MAGLPADGAFGALEKPIREGSHRAVEYRQLVEFTSATSQIHCGDVLGAVPIPTPAASDDPFVARNGLVAALLDRPQVCLHCSLLGRCARFRLVTLATLWK